MIEKLGPQPHSNRRHVRIHDRRTGKSKDFYAEEFIYGQMHYDEQTRKYPDYVHGEVWRLIG
jgi:hypothetical protein